MTEDCCLHCAVMATVEHWFKEHGARQNGRVVIDVALAIQKLSECTVQVSQMADKGSAKRRAFRFAHDCLDGQLQAVRTGKLVPVDIPSEN